MRCSGHNGFTTFIPCSAKLPIISLIAGAFFPGSVWVAPSVYFIGIAAIICSGIILKKTKALSGNPSPFVMELPAYHVPGVKNVALNIWDKTKSFCMVPVHFNWRLQMVDASDSMLAGLGNIVAPLFIPLGWGTWEAAVATLTGLAAKENVVGTFGVLYGQASFICRHRSHKKRNEECKVDPYSGRLSNRFGICGFSLHISVRYAVYRSWI